MEPCWSESDAVPFSRAAARSRNICFREIWLEDLAAEPAAGPGLWILSGLGAKNRGSSVSNDTAQRFFGGGVTGLFGMKAFIIPSISWLHVLMGLLMTSYPTAAWNRLKIEGVTSLRQQEIVFGFHCCLCVHVCACRWCTYDSLSSHFYELVPK